MNARVKAAQLLIEYTAGKPATAPTKRPATTPSSNARWNAATFFSLSPPPAISAS